MRKETLLNRILGSFYGCAIGDALGRPAEFVTHKLASQMHFDSMEVDDSGIARVTDDTIMTLYVAKALLDCGQHHDPDAAFDNLGAALHAWLQDPNAQLPIRGNGMACLRGARAIAKGVDPRLSGAPDARGCGSAMRSGPYGIWLYDDWEEAARWAALHSWSTHDSKEAAAAAASVAAATAIAMSGGAINAILYTMEKAARSIDPYVAEMIHKASKLSQQTRTNWDDVLHEWQSFKAAEVVATAALAMGVCIEFEKAVLMAVNIPGDSDSVGAIVGSILGAKVGAERLDPELINVLEMRDLMEEIAQALTDNLM